MAQNVRINSINSFQVAIESSMQDGAVEVKKEPLERSKALEDPEAAAEILIETPEAEKFVESISNRLSKFEESSIKSTVGGVDEVIEIEETFVELIVEAGLEAAEEVKRLSLVDRP